MLVSDILRRKGSEVVSASPMQTLAGASRLMAERGIGSVLVLDNGEIAGILSERDVVRRVAEAGAECLDQPVAEVMTRRVVTCEAADSLEGILSVMTEGRFRHLPVVEGGRMIGLVSIGDVVKHRLEEAKAEVAHLSAYVAGG